MKNGFSFAALMLCAASALAQQNDWLIVPGKRLGPIAADTTRADLNRLFGKVSIHDRQVDTGEGPEPTTVVFPNIPAESVAVFWFNNRIRHAMVCYRRSSGPCKWHAENGVTVGTSLRQLERLNVRPIEIEPWVSDVGGAVISWQGGRLSDLFGDGANGRASIRLGWKEGPSGPTTEQRQLLQQMDRQARCCLSTDRAVRRLHPAVTRMGVEF